MAHWHEHEIVFVQSNITTQLRHVGPRVYKDRVLKAQKLAIAAYKSAFEKAMLDGQVESHTTQRTVFKEYYDNVDLEQVYVNKNVTKITRRKKLA
jgi:hypothetical protein